MRDLGHERRARWARAEDWYRRVLVFDPHDSDIHLQPSPHLEARRGNRLAAAVDDAAAAKNRGRK